MNKSTKDKYNQQKRQDKIWAELLKQGGFSTMWEVRKMKQCKKCKFYPDDCGYWKLEKDSGGNKIRRNPDQKHNCPDFKSKEVKNEQ